MLLTAANIRTLPPLAMANLGIRISQGSHPEALEFLPAGRGISRRILSIVAEILRTNSADESMSPSDRKNRGSKDSNQ